MFEPWLRTQGWLSWQRYRCNMDCKNDPDNCFSERLIKKTIDAMVSEGYKDVGYEYALTPRQVKS